MPGVLSQILGVVTVADQLLGSATAKALLDYLGARYALSDEQRENLDANYRDYVMRMARLREETAPRSDLG